jgi:hypothetical protein
LLEHTAVDPVRDVVDDPQSRPAGGAQVIGDRGAQLRPAGAIGERQPQRRRDRAHLVAVPGQDIGAGRPGQARAEDSTGEGLAEVPPVRGGKCRLATSRHADQPGHRPARDRGDHRDIGSMQRGVQLPLLAIAPHERRHPRHPVRIPGGARCEADVAEGALDRSGLRGHGLDQGRHASGVGGLRPTGELGVGQLHRLQMMLVRLRVDHQDPPERIPLARPSQKRRGQLELAGRPRRIGRRVENHHDLGPVQVLRDLGRDAPSHRELLIQPDVHTPAHSLGETPGAPAVRPGEREEDVVVRHARSCPS